MNPIHIYVSYYHLAMAISSMAISSMAISSMAISSMAISSMAIYYLLCRPLAI